MELKFLKDEKNEVEFEINSLTLAEILRVYLNENSDVTFAAWKREHYTKSPVMKVMTKDKDAKKLIKEAIDTVSKELDELSADFKKLK